MSHDVAIVGAGPAGSALAIRLADAGHSVVLLESGRFEAMRIGESLAPDVQPLLRDLGAWDDFMATEPVPSLGTRSLWGGPDVETHSHLLGPYRHGWHIDRRAFDATLARVASGRGADLRCGAKVTTIDRHADRWTIGVDDDAPAVASVLVDASGRNGRLGRSLGVRRLVFDRLVGVGRTWREAEGSRAHVLVEATADGWWYTAPIPGDGLVTLLMTDADVCRRDRLTDPASWGRALGRARLTAARIGQAVAASPIRSHAAFSARGLRDDNDPWLAVGDAALAVDPLTGSGVTRALRTAESAAVTVADLLAASDESARCSTVRHYEHERNVDCDRYLHERLDFYEAGPAIPSPFWSRRRQVANRRRARRLSRPVPPAPVSSRPGST